MHARHARRARHWLFGVSTGLVAVGVFGGGCGSVETAPPVVDSGAKDVTVADVAPDVHAADVGADVPAVGCGVDADITKLALPDAALADGATSIGICSACAQAKCGSQLQACNDDCDCREAVVGFFDCYSKTQSIVTCGAPLITLGGEAMQLGQALFVCISPSFLKLPGTGCEVECAVKALLGTDAGPDAKADAAADAPNDAPADTANDAADDAPSDSPNDG